MTARAVRGPRKKAATVGFADTAPLFAALGDATRLYLIARLCDDGPLPIVGLAEDAKVSRQAITKHLLALQSAGVVRSNRAGRERIWELQPKRLADARRLLESISSQWDEALARLQTWVESTSPLF